MAYDFTPDEMNSIAQKVVLGIPCPEWESQEYKDFYAAIKRDVADMERRGVSPSPANEIQVDTSGR